MPKNNRKKSIKRQSRNKSTLMSILLVLFVCIVIGLAIFLPKMISPELMIPILLVICYLLIIPIFNYRYYKMNDTHCKFYYAFVPILNEICVMSSVILKISLCILIIGLLSFLGFLIPTSFFSNFLDIHNAVALSENSKNIFYYSVIAYGLITGIGYIKIYNEINSFHKEIFPQGSSSKFLSKLISVAEMFIPFLKYIILFLPILRCIILADLSEKMEGMLLCDITFSTNIYED